MLRSLSGGGHVRCGCAFPGSVLVSLLAFHLFRSRAVLAEAHLRPRHFFRRGQQRCRGISAYHSQNIHLQRECMPRLFRTPSDVFIFPQAELLDILSASPSTRVNTERSDSSPVAGAPERASFFSGLVVKNGKQSGTGTNSRGGDEALLDFSLQQSCALPSHQAASADQSGNTAESSSSDASKRSCDNDILSLESVLSSSVHTGAQTRARTGSLFPSQPASFTGSLPSLPAASDFPKRSPSSGVRVVPTCSPLLLSAGPTMPCTVSGGSSPDEASRSSGMSLPSSTSLTSLVGEGVSSTASSVMQQPVQSRTAHLDRVFNSGPPAASTGQCTALPTGYAALFPQQQHTSFVGLHKEGQGYRPNQSSLTPSCTQNSCFGLSPPSALAANGQTGAVDVALGKVLGSSPGTATRGSSEQDARRKFAFVST